jgi:hypothetical protein
MKYIIFKLLIPFMALLLFSSCGEEDFVQYEQGPNQQITDASLQIATSVISFQGGTPSYNLKFDLINGVKKVTKLNVYSIYTDANTGKTSNEVLFKSYPVGNDAKTQFNESFTYGDLKNGVMVNGGGLPASDIELAVGSGWKFRFEGETAQGNVPLKGNVNVAVLSRFAGLYRVVESSYFRIGVATDLPGWQGGTRFIGSVDENTFSYNDFWGGFAWTGSSFRFKIDLANNTIQVPILVNGAIFSGNRPLDCAVEPQTFTSVTCAGSNVFIKDDTNGKHTIKLTYGYFTDGSGSREFSEVLEKIN